MTSRSDEWRYAIKYHGKLPTSNCPVAYVPKGVDAAGGVSATIYWNGDHVVLMNILNWFKQNCPNNENARMKFPTTISKHERSNIHEKASRKSLKSESHGRKQGRYLVVYATPLITKRFKDEALRIVQYASNYGIDISKYNQLDLETMLNKSELSEDIAAFWPPKMTADNVKWIPVNNVQEFGRFFVSKPAGEESNLCKDVQDASIRLDDLLCTKSVVSVVMVTTERDPLGVCLHFPSNVPITVVCSGERLSTSAFRTVVPFCHQHGQGQGGHCGCDNERTIDVINPPGERNKLKTNLAIVRYETHVRIIICPTLDKDLWETVLVYGWYCDLPIVNEPGESPLESAVRRSKFGVNLSRLLTSLGVESLDVLCDVDFTVLSPCVRLEVTYPGHKAFDLTVAVKDANFTHGEPVQTVFQTTALPKVFNRFQTVGSLLSSVTNHDIKMVFPTRDSVKKSWPPVILQKLHHHLCIGDKRLQCVPYLSKYSQNTMGTRLANVFCATQSCDSVGEFGLLAISGSSLWDLMSDKFDEGTALSHATYSLAVVFQQTAIGQSNGRFMRAIPNLSTIPRLFKRPDICQYGNQDAPIVEARRHIGIVARVSHEFCFVDPTDHPDAQYCDPFPTSVESAFLHRDTCQMYGMTGCPEKNTILEFLALVMPAKLRGKLNYRVAKIFRVIGVKDFDHMTSSVPMKILQRPQDMTFRGQMARLGLQTDEDIESYMSSQCNKTSLLSQHRKKDNLPYTMEPTKIQCRSTWLENHVKNVCGGIPDKLEGPLAWWNLEKPLNYQHKKSFIFYKA